MEKKSKTVIITGGATGLGLEMANKFINSGYNICICGRRRSALDQARRELEKNINFNDSSFIAIKADMSIEDDVKNLIEITKKSFSSIDIFINNAGVWNEDLISDFKSDDIDKMYNNNLKSVIIGTQYAGRELINGGSIINIGSYGGVLSIKSASLYSSFKAAVHHFTKSAAYEFSEKNIRVNCVIPGVISTPMTEDYIRKHSKKLLKPIALKRFGTTTDIANGVFFLSSENASYITGISLEITGGKYLTQI